MRTDDFLADLGEQLRTARPRRDLRPLAGVAVLAVLAIAALVLVPRGEDRAGPKPAVAPAPAPQATKAGKVGVLNGTTRPGIASQTVDHLRRAGYDVLRASNAPDQAVTFTTVDALDPRFADAARALRRRLGAMSAPRDRLAAFRALVPRAGIVVILGGDANVAPLAATVPRVRVVNQSGSADWGAQMASRLRARGLTVTETTTAGRAFRTRVVALGPDRGQAAETAAALGVPDNVATRGSSPDGGSADTVVYLGEDLPGATLLESALPLREVTCVPATPRRRRMDPFDGPDPTYVCQSPPRRFYDVQVATDGSFVYERRGSGNRYQGTGARP